MIFIGSILGGKLMEKYIQKCTLTLNTTRVCANNPIDISIDISEIGYTHMRPNAVILVSKEEVFDAILASPLVHLPINAPILFTDSENLRQRTLKEIERLSPKGYKGVHLFIIGDISRSVILELEGYGYKTHQIKGSNHYETACMIPSIREDFKNIIIMSGEYYSEGISATYWSAHHGDPILYVKRNSIPYCTIETIRKNKDINIYIIGSTKTVSKAVENYLSRLENVNHIERIDGDDPYEIAVNFAKYKSSETEFGWDRNDKDGHAFTFGEVNYPIEITAGVLFAHMGKHTPLLLIKNDSVPKVVEDYIKSVKPIPPKDMPIPPFMHGFILGTSKNISHKAQVIIDESLSIDHDMMENQMGMNMKPKVSMEHRSVNDMYIKHYPHHMDHEQEEEGENIDEHSEKVIDNYRFRKLNVDYEKVNVHEILG